MALHSGTNVGWVVVPDLLALRRSPALLAQLFALPDAAGRLVVEDPIQVDEAPLLVLHLQVLLRGCRVCGRGGGAGGGACGGGGGRGLSFKKEKKKRTSYRYMYLHIPPIWRCLHYYTVT